MGLMNEQEKVAQRIKDSEKEVNNYTTQHRNTTQLQDLEKEVNNYTIQHRNTTATCYSSAQPFRQLHNAPTQCNLYILHIQRSSWLSVCVCVCVCSRLTHLR